MIEERALMDLGTDMFYGLYNEYNYREQGRRSWDSVNGVASIPGRVFAFITVRPTTGVCLTVIKAKTRPGIEAINGAH